MRRSTLIAIVAVALVAGLAVAVPPFLSADFIKQRIAENIAAMTGREVAVRGVPVLTIYPSVAFTVSDVTIANPPGMSGEPLLTSESVTAHVRLLPLLLGNAQFETVELHKPRIHLVTNADRRNNWQVAPASSGASGAPPRRIRISAGTIVYDDVTSGRHEELTEVDLEASLPTAATPLIATGQLRWRGEPIDFNGQVGQAGATGGSTPLRLALTAKPLRLSFNGSIGPSLSGTLSATTPALRRAIEWMGRPMGSGPTLGAASLSGKLDWTAAGISFAEARIELDGNSAVGAIALSLNASRPRVEGTLAATQLDLSPYIDAFRDNADPLILLAPVGLPVAEAVQVDLRLSAEKLTIGGLRLENAAGTIGIADGRATVNLAESQFYGGGLTANLLVEKFGDTLSSRLTARLSRVAARPALTDLAAIQVVDGIANADLQFTSAGASWGEFVQRLSGRGSFTLQEGALAGLDIGTLSSLADPPPEPIAAGTGSLRFATVTATATLDAGILETTDVVVRGDAYRIDLKGWGSLASGIVDAKATLSLATGDGRAKIVPIAIGGTWRRPLFELDRTVVNPATAPPPRG
jgi:AsmA protein